MLFLALVPFSFASLPHHQTEYDGAGTITAQTRYVYDGWQLIQEIDALTDTVLSEYVYGPGYIDDVVLSLRDSDAYYHHSDQQYSTVALTDANGDAVEYYGYDAFGAPSFYDSTGAPLAASTVNNPVLYTGRAWDTELAFYDYRNRMYDPATGRFTTPDPIGAHGDWNNLGNAYTYVGNNPWRFVDPWGLSMELATQRSYPVLSGTFGFFVGAGQGIAVAIDTPAMIPEWLGVGERPLKYIGAYEDTDPGIGAARAAAGVGWGAGVGSGGVAVLAPNLGTASLASPSALYTAAWLDALSLGTGVSATGLTTREALHRSSRSLAQRPGQVIRAISARATAGTQGKFQNVPAMANSFKRTVASRSGLEISASTTGKGYKSLYYLKKDLGAARPGKVWHHIVEQTPTNKARFGAEAIHNTRNVIDLPHGKGSVHAKISGYYSSKVRPITGDLTVRQWLSTKSYDFQYEFGIDALKKFGVK